MTRTDTIARLKAAQDALASNRRNAALAMIGEMVAALEVSDGPAKPASGTNPGEPGGGYAEAPPAAANDHRPVGDGKTPVDRRENAAVGSPGGLGTPNSGVNDVEVGEVPGVRQHSDRPGAEGSECAVPGVPEQAHEQLWRVLAKHDQLADTIPGPGAVNGDSPVVVVITPVVLGPVRLDSINAGVVFRHESDGTHWVKQFEGAYGPPEIAQFLRDLDDQSPDGGRHYLCMAVDQWQFGMYAVMMGDQMVTQALNAEVTVRMPTVN